MIFGQAQRLKTRTKNKSKMDSHQSPSYLCSGAAILEVIPQKPPIVMIDKLISVSEQSAKSELTLLAENIFCENGYFQAAGLVENIAQTAAAQVGYLSQQKGQKPPIGFIGAIKNLKILHLPPIEATICTSITVENEIMGFTIINGISTLGNTILAQCQMKILVQEQDDEKK